MCYHRYYYIEDEMLKHSIEEYERAKQEHKWLKNGRSSV